MTDSVIAALTALSWATTPTKLTDLAESKVEKPLSKFTLRAHPNAHRYVSPNGEALVAKNGIFYVNTEAQRDELLRIGATLL